MTQPINTPPERVKRLMERFFDGATSNAEERELYAYFRRPDLPAEWLAYRDLFAYFEQGLTDAALLDSISGDASTDLDFGKVLSIMDSTGRRVCRHHVVGALLASKQEEAENAGVEVDFDLDVPDDLPFSDTELCAVFSNLFDNAVNACAQVSEGEKRFIEMKAYSRDAFFIVDVVNSCSKAQMKRERRRDTLFSEHGWGLSIIQAVAERHGGMLETEQQGNRFHTTVAMSLAAQEALKG